MTDDSRPFRPRLVRDATTLRAGEATEWLDDLRVGGDGLGVLGSTDGVLVALADEPGADQWIACSLATLSVPEVVTVIIEARHSGVVEVWDPRGRRRLFFEHGSYTGAMSTHQADRLGEVIWREGRISLDQLIIISENLEPGKRIGRLLVEFGYIEQRELRGWLRQQAQAVFEAACLENEGEIWFQGGQAHPNPVRFGAETERILDGVLPMWEECRRLLRKLRPLDAPAKPVVPTPRGALSEAQEAMVQLAMSAKTPLTRGQLLSRSGLGQLHGVRALAKLVEADFFEPIEEVADGGPERPSRMARLCDAVNLVLAELREVGSEAVPVHEFLEHPPAHLKHALAGIDITDGLDAEDILARAMADDGDPIALASGLMLLLDYALFEARDTLADDAADALHDKVAALDVF